MRKLLSRFSFSFIGIAMVLAYSGYRGSEQGGNRSRVALYYLGAAAAGSLGLAGVRDRHRRE
jgi:hypothetical protein